MSIYIDANAFVRWEKGEFDLIAWLEARGDETAGLPATVWQELNFGVFAWESRRAAKRSRSLAALGAMIPVIPFNRGHAEGAAELSAQLKLQQIGIADAQIAATALMDGAELLTFNTEHFGRVPNLKLATP